MGGKQSAPASPNYQPIATASTDAAKIQAQTSQDQLDWSKQQYADQAPATKDYLKSMIANTDQQTTNAKNLEDQYTSTYQPLMSKFAAAADSYSSPQRQEQNAGAAMADVNNAFDSQRQSALSSLESFGVDPSQTRYGALDLGTRVQQAASSAAAGTQSRLQTEQTGLALTGQAIAQGQQLPSQTTQSYGGAQTSGASGIGSALNTSSTYGNLMGTGLGWAGASTSSNAGAVSAMNTGFSNQLSGVKENNQTSLGQGNMIGSLVGGGMMAGAIAI